MIVVTVLLCVLAVGGVGAFSVHMFREAERRSIRGRYRSLGDTRGHTLAEITAVMGAPTARTIEPDGMLLEWIDAESGYRVTLAFTTEGSCRGLRHEYGGRLR